MSSSPVPSSTPSFHSFPLAEPILRGLNASGFRVPTEVQAKALPLALSGRDLMVSAQTGTGKTAAFVLPALQRLLQPAKSKGKGPRVLILTPTRELAAQVETVVRQLGRHTRLTFGSIVGGVAMGPQHRLLRAPLDILVATPGRLMDHMSQGGLDFSRLELFVLDEADRMLDMGFVRPVKKIASALPSERQTLLFSATLEGAVGEIARGLLRDAARVQLATARMKHESIAQRLHIALSPEHKHALLAHLLADPALERAIVFISTKRGADKLAKRLNAAGFACAALHGNMKQNARTRTVDLLRRGKVNILIATDVAARGIDLTGISHVINFNLPMVAEDYIHRIGRTGRNGATGTAISLVDADDRVKLGMIERLTGRKLERQELAGFAWTPPPRGERRPELEAAEPERRPVHPRGGAQHRPGHTPSGTRDSRVTRHEPRGNTGSGRDRSRAEHAQGNHRAAGEPVRAADGNRRAPEGTGRVHDGNRRDAAPAQRRGMTSGARPTGGNSAGNRGGITTRSFRPKLRASRPM